MDSSVKSPPLRIGLDFYDRARAIEIFGDGVVTKGEVDRIIEMTPADSTTERARQAEAFLNHLGGALYYERPFQYLAVARDSSVVQIARDANDVRVDRNGVVLAPVAIRFEQDAIKAVHTFRNHRAYEREDFSFSAVADRVLSIGAHGGASFGITYYLSNTGERPYVPAVSAAGGAVLGFGLAALRLGIGVASRSLGGLAIILGGAVLGGAVGFGIGSLIKGGHPSTPVVSAMIGGGVGALGGLALAAKIGAGISIGALGLVGGGLVIGGLAAFGALAYYNRNRVDEYRVAASEKAHHMIGGVIRFLEKISTRGSAEKPRQEYCVSCHNMQDDVTRFEHSRHGVLLREHAKIKHVVKNAVRSERESGGCYECHGPEYDLHGAKVFMGSNLKRAGHVLAAAFGIEDVTWDQYKIAEKDRVHELGACVRCHNPSEGVVRVGFRGGEARPPRIPEDKEKFAGWVHAHVGDGSTEDVIMARRMVKAGTLARGVLEGTAYNPNPTLRPKPTPQWRVRIERQPECIDCHEIHKPTRVHEDEKADVVEGDVVARPPETRPGVPGLCFDCHPKGGTSGWHTKEKGITGEAFFKGDSCRGCHPKVKHDGRFVEGGQKVFEKTCTECHFTGEPPTDYAAGVTQSHRPGFGYLFGFRDKAASVPTMQGEGVKEVKCARCHKEVEKEGLRTAHRDEGFAKGFDDASSDEEDPACGRCHTRMGRDKIHEAPFSAGGAARKKYDDPKTVCKDCHAESPGSGLVAMFRRAADLVTRIWGSHERMYSVLRRSEKGSPATFERYLTLHGCGGCHGKEGGEGGKARPGAIGHSVVSHRRKRGGGGFPGCGTPNSMCHPR